MKSAKISFDKQNGAATLVVAVVLLIAVTLVVIFATRVGLMDQKASGNQYRHKQAFASAEAGMEYAASYLRANPILHNGNPVDGWNSCAGSEGLFPCNVEDAEFVLGTIAGGVITSTVPTISDAESYLVKTPNSTVIIGTGTSDDNTGNSVVQAQYSARNLIVPGQLPPLMVPSGDLSGSFNIVPNPNGGGPGVPISVWATDTIDTSGANWKTCDHDQFRDGGAVCMDTKGDGQTGDNWQGCSCGNERSNSTNVNSDIVMDSAANFPASPFVYVFGDPDTDNFATLREEIKALADSEGLLLPACTNLDAEFSALTGSALVWVEGDCLIGNNVQIASRDKPIILVVEDEIRINAGAEVWGIIVGLDEFILTGSPVIHGSAISEIESELTNGSYSQVYDEDVFTNITDPDVNTILSRVMYSWRDFGS